VAVWSGVAIIFATVPAAADCPSGHQRSQSKCRRLDMLPIGYTVRRPARTRRPVRPSHQPGTRCPAALYGV